MWDLLSTTGRHLQSTPEVSVRAILSVPWRRGRFQPSGGVRPYALGIPAFAAICIAPVPVLD